MTQATQTRKPKIGLVIGSGSIKCSAALGLFKVLKRERVAVDLLVGCSGGSIYAAAHAIDWDFESSTELNQQMWTGLFNKLSYRTLLSILLPRLYGFDERMGLLNDARVNEVIRTVYGDKTFAEARIPLYIVATDLKTSREVVLSEGRLADAVRASIALPILLPPWERQGQLLVDGGLSDPLPISVAIREGCDIILAMGFDNAPVTRIASFTGLIEQTINTLTNNLIKSTFAFYSAVHHAEVIPMMPVFDSHIGLDDVTMLPQIIAAGERSAAEQMPYLKRLLQAAQ